MKPAIIVFLLILVTGCTITGKVVEEIEEQPTMEIKESAEITKAIQTKDIKICYYIQSQKVREDCFIQLAKELNDPSICKNLLGSLRDICKNNI